MNYGGYRQQSKSSVIAELIHSKIRQFWSKTQFLALWGFEITKTLKVRFLSLKAKYQNVQAPVKFSILF